jgi:hypothetical protein
MAINYVKLCGWLILVAGLALIVYSVKTSYSYFTGKAEFPVLVEAPTVSNGSGTENSGNSNVDLADPQAVQAMMQVQIQGSVDKTINNMVPSGSIAKMINAAIWSVFATFLVYAGAKISEIGVKMLTAKPQTE